MTKNGFHTVKKVNELKPGDIIIFGTKDPITGKENWIHTFVITAYDPKTGKCSKLDYGKNERIHSSQPFENVDLDEWNGADNDMEFMIAYRPNYNILEKNRKSMNSFLSTVKEEDEKLIKKFKKIEKEYINPTQRLIENLSEIEGHQKIMNEKFPTYDYSLKGFTEAKNGTTDQDVIDVSTILNRDGMKGMPNNLKFVVEADVMHKYLENTNNNSNPNDDFKYFVTNFEGLPQSFNDLPDDEKHVCCATYVSWAMKLGGYMTDEEGGKENMHQSVQLNNFFQNNTDRFIEQNDYDNLMPGDILYYSPEDGGPHIEIFAGYEVDEDNNINSVVLNCGSNYWISAELPTSRDDSSYQRKRRTPTKVWRIQPYK